MEWINGCNPCEGLPSLSQMQFQNLERTFTRCQRCFLAVARIQIAVEPRAPHQKGRFQSTDARCEFGQSPELEYAHPAGRSAKVKALEASQRHNEQFARRLSQQQPRLEPQSPHSNSRLLSWSAARKLDGEVEERVFGVQLRKQAHRLLPVCPAVIRLDAGLDAIEQIWCPRQKPIFCMPGVHGAWVSVHAKYLPHHNQPGHRLARLTDDTQVLAFGL
jgi:hypothetical protein